VIIVLRQKDMEQNMLMAHRQFISGLEKTLDMLNEDIKAVEGVSGKCTDEWCKSRENFLDYLHKSIYSVSEPRWGDKEDSQKIHELRNRIKDLYVHFNGVKA
jgi:hypothetical protein